IEFAPACPAFVEQGFQRHLFQPRADFRFRRHLFFEIPKLKLQAVSGKSVFGFFDRIAIWDAVKDYHLETFCLK
ncbi:hypothetical protein LN384_24865, partial [Enterobacter hormaechei subsp. steigerwaltii]|nr:hypothetical protein [Enterobacter hormaechei subsp. steigerwaltii]